MAILTTLSWLSKLYTYICVYTRVYIYIYIFLHTYSKIPLIQITWDQTCARLAAIWLIRQYLYSPNVLQIIFCYYSCTWSAQLNKRVVHFDISYSCWFTVSRVLCCVFWSLHRWKGWCNRRHVVRRYHNGWCTNILGGFANHASQYNLSKWPT